MLKNIFILAFTIFSLVAFGQKTTFEKNVNPEADILEQRLSDNGDSLLLNSKRTIRQVDIFNEDYMKSIVVNGNTSKIDLGNLPIGDFIIQARIGGKRIIMYVSRIESSIQNPELNKLELNKHSGITSIQNRDINIASDTSAIDKKSKKSPSAFWVVHEINTNFGSSKTMSLEDEIAASKMIALNKKEVNTEIAKNNTLIVYEVYNPSKFMEKQLKRRKYYKSSQSIYFNVNPYYSSEEAIENSKGNYNNNNSRNNFQPGSSLD